MLHIYIYIYIYIYDISSLRVNRHFTKLVIFRNKNLHTLACFFISRSFVRRFQANIVLGRLLFLTLHKQQAPNLWNVGKWGGCFDFHFQNGHTVWLSATNFEWIKKIKFGIVQRQRQYEMKVACWTADVLRIYFPSGASYQWRTTDSHNRGLHCLSIVEFPYESIFQKHN